MQVQGSMSLSQLGSANSTSSSSSTLNSSTEFQDYVNKRMYEIQSETSVPVSSSSSENKSTSTSKTENDKKTDTTDKKDDSGKKTDKKTDEKEVNEEAVEAVVTPEVEQVVTDELLAMLTGAIDLSQEVEEVEVAIETGEIQVIDLKQAKLATNELTYEEPVVEEAVVEEEVVTNTMEMDTETEEQVAETEVVEEVQITEEAEVSTEEAEEVVVKNTTEEVEVDETMLEDGEDVNVTKANIEVTESTTTTLSEVAKDEDVVFIKVGDTKLDESWQKVLDNMGKDIIAKEAAGIDKFTVILNPNGLGEVKVEILQQDSGLLVNLICNQSGTANLLNDNLLGLTKLLEANFGDDSNVIVTDDAQESGEREMNQDNAQKQDQEAKEVEEEVEIEVDFMERMRLGLFGN